MLRSIGITALSLAALTTLNAGQIYIGTGPNGTYGLTGGATPTVTGTNVGPTKYIGSVFNGATVTGTAIPNGNTATPTTISGGGTSFALVDNLDQNGGAQTDFAGLNMFGGGTGSVFNINIGLLGVNSIDTMLQDEYGINGVSDSTIQFNFTDSTVARNPLTPIIFTLVNGNEIRSGTACTGSTGAGSTFTDGGGAGGTGSCTNYARTLTGLRYGTDGTTPVAVGVAPTETAFNVYSSTYSGDTNAPFLNTSGNLFLDGQNFNFAGLHTNDYLSSVTITNTDNNGAPARLVLSAITVDTAATPEPSAFLLAFGGIGAIAFYRRRRSC